MVIQVPLERLDLLFSEYQKYRSLKQQNQTIRVELVDDIVIESK